MSYTNPAYEIDRITFSLEAKTIPATQYPSPTSEQDAPGDYAGATKEDWLVAHISVLVKRGDKKVTISGVKAGTDVVVTAHTYDFNPTSTTWTWKLNGTTDATKTTSTVTFATLTNGDVITATIDSVTVNVTVGEVTPYNPQDEKRTMLPIIDFCENSIGVDVEYLKVYTTVYDADGNITSGTNHLTAAFPPSYSDIVNDTVVINKINAAIKRELIKEQETQVTKKALATICAVDGISKVY